MTYSSFNYRYSGGSLEVNDPTYVVRQADRDFYSGLKAGEFCYVLNSRQMGKSSLRVRTMARLQGEGTVCAFIDLSGIGKEGITPEQWYADIVRSLVNSCPIQFNWRSWWREQRDLLSPAQRLKVFIEEILLVEVRERIVIFVDEIDRVLSQDFALDDFFAIIRAGYNLRGHKPEYCRLTWAVLGVATPSDLIENPHATPFNIGKAIALQGFQFTESRVLLPGLSHISDYPEQLLREILFWTGGQPFLTQKLCWAIANTQSRISSATEAAFVEELVKNLIQNWESQDEPPHFKTIRTRLLYSTQSSKKLLLLYQKLLRWGKITAKKYPEHRELQLSGLVVKRGKYLKVYNPIYQAVFDRRWVKQQLAVLDRSDKIALKTVFFTSATITFIVAIMRSLSMLQGWELAAFDFLMRHRPLETPDSRLLIIGATEQDLTNYGYPIPDAVLARLLNKIQQAQPSAIGLDIVRDLPVPKNDLSGHQALNSHLENNPQLIPVCAFDTNPTEAIAPPPASPHQKLGFVDLYDDLQYRKRDDTVRRYLLSRSSDRLNSICPTAYSFAWQLIYLYLKERGIAIDTVDNNWRFGSLIIQRLQQQSGGYQNLDSRGNQILINYRNTANLQQVAPQISVSEILNNTKKLNANLIKNKIILIGVTAPSIPDRHDTPYGEMKGIEVHAHAISQIIAAVENNRPLIYWLRVWQDIAFIWFWSVAGGIVICYVQIPLYRNLITGTSIIVLYSCCWIAFVWGLWLPLIPSAIALSTTVICLIARK